METHLRATERHLPYGITSTRRRLRVSCINRMRVIKSIKTQQTWGHISRNSKRFSELFYPYTKQEKLVIISYFNSVWNVGSYCEVCPLIPTIGQYYWQKQTFWPTKYNRSVDKTKLSVNQ